MKNILEKILIEEKTNRLNEGIVINKNKFDFDFNKDGINDIIHLCNDNLEQREFMGISYYYYAYHFTDNTPSQIRTQFIHELKFPQGDENAEEIKRFISVAIGRLDKEINLSSYDVIVIPQSKSSLARKISMEAYLHARPSGGVTTFELLKELPSNIEFDIESYKTQILDDYVNGRPRYTEKEKMEVIEIINRMMEKIHSLDYFSIARDVTGKKYKPFITNYLKFKNERDKNLYKNLSKSNVLIIDDILTNGTTIQQILKTIRTVNDSNNITIFSLIGK